MAKENKESLIKQISLFTIIEILILAFGVFLSVHSTLKPLKYTYNYAWCFIFAFLGIGFIAVLIIFIKKKWIWIVGSGLIFGYLIIAGFGSIVCEMNYSRLRYLEYYKDKTIQADVDSVDYEWDQQSVTYNSSGLEYYGMDLSSSQSSLAYSNSSMPIAVIIDGEKTSYPVYKDSVSENVYYRDNFCRNRDLSDSFTKKVSPVIMIQ